MHILLTTYGLLLVFTMFCAAQWRSATDMVFLDAAAIESFAESRNATFQKFNERMKRLAKKNQPPEAANKNSQKNKPEQAQEVVEDDEDEEDEEPREEPEEEEDKKPQKNKTENCTSYLHIAEMFRGENPTITDKKGRATFTLLKNLISTLYEGNDFFKEAKAEVPDLEERFITTLFERAKDAQAGKQWITKVNKLGKLDLEDELMTHLRYKTFTGNKPSYSASTRDQAGYFALTEFTSMIPRKTIMSLWRAPKPLLMALFQNSDTVDEVLQFRREIFKEVRKNKSLAAGKEREFHDRFSQGIDLDIVEFIDFKVSTSPPPDMPRTKKER